MPVCRGWLCLLMFGIEPRRRMASTKATKGYRGRRLCQPNRYRRTAWRTGARVRMPGGLQSPVPVSQPVWKRALAGWLGLLSLTW